MNRSLRIALTAVLMLFVSQQSFAFAIDHEFRVSVPEGVTLSEIQPIHDALKSQALGCHDNICSFRISTKDLTFTSGDTRVTFSYGDNYKCVVLVTDTYSVFGGNATVKPIACMSPFDLDTNVTHDGKYFSFIIKQIAPFEVKGKPKTKSKGKISLSPRLLRAQQQS